MKIILNLILILFTVNINGQELNTEYIELKTSLLKSNNDLVIELKTSCTGGSFISKEDAENCVYETPFYLFWTKNDKYFRRKFSNCKVFPELKMEASELLDTVKMNLIEIEKAEILPVISEAKNSNGEVEITELSFSPFCESKFVIHSSNKIITKNIIDFHLQTEFVSENVSNDNYLKNQASILNTVFNLAVKETR